VGLRPLFGHLGWNLLDLGRPVAAGSAGMARPIEIYDSIE
jgi:hypothetical protein